MDLPFVKGHGTENDFVLIPDANGRLDLSADQVVFLCDRRAGVGGDGVIRVVRTDASDDPAAVAARGEARWFMDYRNSDGSISEMCGNGVRVFARYLATHADVDVRSPLPIATRAGVKVVTFDKAGITVDMGTPEVVGAARVSVAEATWDGLNLSMGNPHAVVFVDSLDDAGPLLDSPTVDESLYPEGVNIEFLQRTGAGRVSMRVHERGSGETRSCGTGACAAMVATQLQDESPRGTPYEVDVPGGRLSLVWSDDDRILLTGPAELVAEGSVSLPTAERT